MFNFESFLNAYIICALWSSVDENGVPMDENHGSDDLAPKTLTIMRADCEKFISDNYALLLQYKTAMKSEQWSGEARAGHDFWLTRNGHGAGFWDRGLGHLGEKLTRAADKFPVVDLYIGDDGWVYA